MKAIHAPFARMRTSVSRSQPSDLTLQRVDLCKVAAGVVVAASLAASESETPARVSVTCAVSAQVDDRREGLAPKTTPAPREWRRLPKTMCLRDGTRITRITKDSWIAGPPSARQPGSRWRSQAGGVGARRDPHAAPTDPEIRVARSARSARSASRQIGRTHDDSGRRLIFRHSRFNVLAVWPSGSLVEQLRVSRLLLGDSFAARQPRERLGSVRSLAESAVSAAGQVRPRS